MPTVTDEELYRLIVDTGNSQQKLDAVADAADRADKAFDGAGKSAKRSVTGMYQLGQIVDDIQYGFRGVTNNIQPLLSSLGIGAGLTGTLTIAAIAAYQLYTRWDELMNAMGAGHVKTQSEQMDELAKKTEKTADETLRLLRYQEQQATIAKQQSSKTDAQNFQNQAVNDAVAQFGYDRAVKAMVELNRTRYENDPRNTELIAQRDSAKGEAEMQIPFGPGSENAMFRRARARERMAEAQSKIDSNVHRSAQEELAGAASDPGRLHGLVNQIVNGKGAFGQGADKLAASLMAGLPENVQATKDNAKAARDAEAKRKEEEKAKKDTAWKNAKMGQITQEDTERERKQVSEDERARKEKEAQSQRERSERFERTGGRAMLDQMMTGLIESGMSPQAAAAKMAPKLFGALGFDAEKVAKESAESAQGDLLRKAISGESSNTRNSAVFAGGDFARAVQGGVSNRNNPEQQLRQLQLIATTLKQLLAQARNNGMGP